jgi:hypothetical protein
VVDVEQVEVRSQQHRVVDIVDVEGNRRLAGKASVTGANAANE